VNYARASKVIGALYADPKFPLTPLRKVVQFAQYGISELASTEATGLPIIRMNNLQADGWDFSDLKYIELSPNDAARYLLEPGDILFNRTNSKELVGKCEVFREEGAWVFASYLIRVRVDTNAIVPDFVSLFLNTRAGRAQIDRISRQIIGMSNVNAEELQDMVIPLASIDVQRTLVAGMQAARETRDEKLGRADALLADLDAYLLDTLNITLPAETSRAIFAIRLRQIEGALNPERYAGLLLAKCIAGRRLNSVARILDAKISAAKVAPAEEWDRIRIDDLPNQPLDVETRRTSLGSELKEAYFEVHENDILLARLGPTIQNTKFVLCPPLRRRTVASGEFLVLRCREGWNPVTVLAVLRTKLFRDIMYSKCRGGTPSRYRVNAEDLATLPFPNISAEVQQQIADEVRQRREEARRLRTEAEAGWAVAKRQFEEQLLASAPEPIRTGKKSA